MEVLNVQETTGKSVTMREGQGMDRQLEGYGGNSAALTLEKPCCLGTFCLGSCMPLQCLPQTRNFLANNTRNPTAHDQIVIGL